MSASVAPSGPPLPSSSEHWAGMAAPAPVAVPDGVVRRLVSLAGRAPSVGNSQPWAWQVRPYGLDLYADESRRLTVEDPDGRNLLISCGAVLHHLQVAARAHGWSATVDRLPDPSDPALLAHVGLSPCPMPTTAAADLLSLRERSTDRRRFTSWPVPDERLVRLAAVAREAGGDAVALVDVSERFQVELLVSRAQHQEARDHANDDVRLVDEPEHDVQGGDGLVLLTGTEDSRLDWLRCGEGLSALWLHATRQGLSVVPLSQVVDVPETRAALQYGVLGGTAVPLLLVRVGWQAITRSQLEPTSRRLVADVLLA